MAKNTKQYHDIDLRWNKMDLQKDIKKLVTYGLDKKLIEPEDEIYTINQYLEVFRLDEYVNADFE